MDRKKQQRNNTLFIENFVWRGSKKSLQHIDDYYEPEKIYCKVTVTPAFDICFALLNSSEQKILCHRPHRLCKIVVNLRIVGAAFEIFAFNQCLDAFLHNPRVWIEKVELGKNFG
mmetsp:Transcript_19408/g.39855  ORF Transcript_19408/g.39855 Transcript_19408/m.39855 type:complete len:115 (+) Transcript_19408:1029-1373(+)